jgi:hypothetical protein
MALVQKTLIQSCNLVRHALLLLLLLMLLCQQCVG